MASAYIFTECESEDDVHNKLMTTFCCDYFGAELWKEKFEKFKLKSFLYLKTPNERSVSHAYDVWSKLEAKGILGQNKYDVLKRLVDEIDDDLLSLIEDAEEKISLLKGEGYQKRKRRKKEHEKDYFQSLKQTVLEFSKRTTENVPVSPFQQYGMLPVELLYAKVVVKTDPRYDEKGRHVFDKSKLQRGRKLNVEGPNDLFYKDKEPAKRIFMTGNPAHGKTTYCIWLLQHWLNSQASKNNKEKQQKEWRKALGIFDFVFLIKLRDVQKSTAYATDMICKDILQLDDESSMLLKEALKSGKYRSLILIDGLDEWRPYQNVTKNTRFRGLPLMDDIKNCVTFITMRNWKFESVAMNVNSNDRVVEIEGLDDNGIKEVTENVLKNYYALDIQKSEEKQKYDTVMSKLKNKTMNSIMKIPLMAVVCVQIWYKGEDIGDSLTQFYIEMIEMLIERAEIPHDINNALEIDGNDGFYFQSYKHVLFRLGKVAYDGLKSGLFSFEFPAKTLTSSLGLTKSEVEFSLNVGILSMEETDSIMTKKVKLFFFHTSVQEFLGAVYVVESEGERHQLYGHLSTLKVILEFSNVLIFLSGLNPIFGSELSKHLVDVANADAEICAYRNFNDVLMGNDSKVESLYKLQVSCLREITNSREIADNKEQGVPYYVSDVYVLADERDDESDDVSGIETLRTTSDILNHHHTAIRSLLVYVAPTDGENGISDTVLTNFLCNTVSLQSLYIDGYRTDRVLHRLCDKFTSLTSLILYGVVLTPDAFSTLQSVIKSNQVLETLGLITLECQANEGQGREPASLSGILQILPDLPRLSKLSIKITNKDDKPVFRDVLSRLSHLHDMQFCGTKPRDDDYDRDVVQTLFTWTELRRLRLVYLELIQGLRIPSLNMVHLEKIMLFRVSMLPDALRKFIGSLSKINHTFEIELRRVYIHDICRAFIRSSPHFEIINNEMDVMNFTRVWPPAQRAHKNDARKQKAK